MDEIDLPGLLAESGALLEGHFALSSGRHAGRYVLCARLLALPARARAVGRALAGPLESHRPQAVVSPALGGVVIGHEVAAALEVPFRFVERREGVFSLRRGFHLRAGERIAVVEDVVTTGGSVRETLEVVAAGGARPVAVGAIIDRGALPAPFAVPFVSLLELEIATYPPESCPHCRAGEPLDRPGSRSPAAQL